jgi:hypothetical protein
MMGASDQGVPVFYVDERTPTAWQSGPMARFIQRINRVTDVFLVIGKRRGILKKNAPDRM